MSGIYRWELGRKTMEEVYAGDEITPQVARCLSPKHRSFPKPQRLHGQAEKATDKCPM